jgi:hypothetical protein
MLKAAVKAITPAPIWKVAHELRARGKRATPLPLKTYQDVSTRHNTDAMHSGRFGEIYERYWTLDPYNQPSRGDRTRMRVYNLCCLAGVATRRAAGDIFMAGVSWGVAQRVLYDYLDLGSAERTMHLVDPFLGVERAHDRAQIEKYNADPEFVRRQYPSGSKISFHQGFIPDCLPLSENARYAVIYLNTGDCISEASSLAPLAAQMSPGGIIVIDNYAIGEGHQNFYEPTLQKIGASPFVLPTGQAVIFR